MKQTLLLKKLPFFSFILLCFLLLSNNTAAQSNITISASATSGGSWSASAPWVFTASGATANIIITDITTKLATGNVTINASLGSGGAGTITLGAALTATLASATQYTLTLSAPGAIALGANKITLTGTAGNPGPNITITGASITSTAATPGITSSGLVGTTTFGKGGNITLTATSGNIAVVGLTANGSAGGSTAPGTAGGNGGTIQVIATGTITTGAISCTGGAATSTGANNGGAGGAVTIQTTGAASTITTGTITTTGGVNTSTGTPGNSGAISITSNLSSITTGAITTTGANAPAQICVGGNAGNVTLIANTNISTGIITAGGGTGGTGGTGGKGGNGGTIAITATTGTYTTSGAYTTTGGAAGGTGSNNGGTGGNVTITANTTISTLAITTSGGAPKASGTTGTSGAVAITSTTSSVSTGGTITTSGTAAGASTTAGASAGNVTITSGTTLTIGTGGIVASGGSGGSTTTGGAGGNGGTVTLTAGTTLTCSTATITTTGANAGGTGNNNGGNGGDILLTTGTTGTISQNLSAAAGTKTGTGVAGTAGNYTFNTGGAVAFSGVANGGNLIKNGTGTLTVSGINTYTGSTTINAGTLELGAANKLTATTNLILNGGTFSTGAITGFAQSFGTLTVSANSTLRLGSGVHTTTFSASSGVGTWVGNLSITNWATNYNTTASAGKIAFTGASATGLSAANLAKITFSGFLTGSKFLGATTEVVPYATCTTPTVQPTLLIFTAVNGTVVTGSFTAATTSPSPTKYLVLRSTSATAPSPAPADGTPYTAGGTVGGATVVQVSSATSFTDSGLSKNTTYYYYIYSFNDQCVGTTQYLTTSPLSGIAKTAANNVWYINNALEANDVYTTAAGSGSNNGLTPGTPYDNLSTLYSTLASANDIIYIDSGTYTTSPIRNIAFDKAITIIGAGPYLTIFDDATHVSYFGLITASNVKISNIKFYKYGNDSSSLRQGTTISVEAAASDLTGIEIKSCWFDNNPGSAQNGALSITTSSTGKITADILNTIFSCNNNGSYGGACTIEGNGHTIGFSKCFFYKNERFAPGGGIYIQGTNSTSGTSTTVNVTNCTFNQNKGTRGGAIAVDVARLNVTNSCFTLNTNSDTSNKGNAISGSRYAIVSITNSKFTSNTGGNSQVSVNTAINTAGWDGPSTDLTITTSNFDASAVNPQAIYFAGTTASVTESTFNSSATTQIENAGGSFTLSNSGAPTKTGTFAGNTSARTASATSAVCMMPVSGVCGAVAVDCTTNDIFAPVINTTVSVLSENGCNFIVPQYTATDACDLTPTVIQTLPEGTILEPGTTTTVAITATDDSGNSSTETITIIAPGCPGLCPTQTVWNGTSWSNSAPTTSVRAILTGNYNSSTNGNMDACNLYIFPSISLTIPDNTYVNVVNSITNFGNNIAIASKGSLIQVNSGATGNAISGGAVDVSNITLTKTTAKEYRYDYVYWSKPISNSSSMLTNFSNAFDLKYYWDASKATSAQKSYLGWQYLTSEPTLATGFIARVKNIDPYNSPTEIAGTPITLAITGTSNNGDYTTPFYDTYDSDALAYKNYSLIGNPYPGAIDFTAFYNDNQDKIYGTAYLWTSHNHYPGIGYYREGDYATFNLSGGVGTGGLPDKGIATHEYEITPNGYIASCQGFMVRPKIGGNLTFKNSHRVKSIINSTNTNEQFFRTTTPEEKNRFWLRIEDGVKYYKEQLIGYFPEATDGLDDAYDGPLGGVGSIKFYSLIDTKKYSIQGKGTFNNNDRVAIGYTKTTTVQEKLIISIAKKEGVFANRQPIYLYDKELDIYTDLNKRPYEFAATTNTENRFEIIYKLPDTEEVNAESNNVVVSIDHQLMTIAADTEIAKVVLYDITGKLVFEKTLDRKSNVVNMPVYISTGVYIAKVTLSNTKTHTLKLIKN